VEWFVAVVFVASVAGSAALADVDLTGDYRVDETGLPLNDVCTANVVQVGTSLTLTASCIGGNFLSGSGTIDPISGDFTLSGTCDVDAPPPGTPQSLALTGTGSQDSLTFTMSGTCGSLETGFFGTKCGNGTSDANEECEDGNRADGDCCSSTCAAETGNVCDAATPECTLALCDATGACVAGAAAEPAGTPCDVDADLCTVDLCDGGGTCAATAAVVTCGLCEEACDPQNGCVATPSEISVHPDPGECTRAFKQSGKLTNRSNDDKDRVTWKWDKGSLVPVADFGTPTLSTGYTLCIFGAGVSGGYQAIGALEIPPGAGWTSAPGGFRFKGSVPGAGKVKIQLRASTGSNHNSRVVVSATGAGLGYPTAIDELLPGTARLGHIELRADNGKCWASEMGVTKSSRTSAVLENLKLKNPCKLGTCR
jgi:cysteine-rich repeat protein